jgi:hypothetical protein
MPLILNAIEEEMKLMKTTFQLVGLTPLLEWNKKREESAQLRFRCFCERPSFKAVLTAWRPVAEMSLICWIVLLFS